MRVEDRRRGRLRFSLLGSLLAAVIVLFATQIMDRSADTGAAITATVRQLWLAPEVYEGKHVATKGFVRVFLAGTTNEHFAVEQVGQHRVGLQGVARAHLLSLLGAEVTVEGVLRFEEGTGVYIEVERLALVGERASAGSAVSIDPRP